MVGLVRRFDNKVRLAIEQRSIDEAQLSMSQCLKKVAVEDLHFLIVDTLKNS